MKNFKFIALFGFLVLNACTDSTSLTSIQFDEREEGIDPYKVRYLITGNMLRVDDNNDASDYILYNDKDRIIYSVNHDDQTVLTIKHNDWKLPKFEFQRNVSWEKIEDAPEFENKPVFNYWLSGDTTVCTEAQVVEGFLLKESGILKRYTETLSAAQVESLSATPKDMRTPCLLIDKVYNTGSVFDIGFPIQQWHKDGLQRIMTSYQTDEKYNEKLFELPKEYKRYSMGDNLGFGER